MRVSEQARRRQSSRNNGRENETRTGWLGGVDERQRERGRKRNTRRRTEMNEARHGRAGQGRARRMQGPRAPALGNAEKRRMNDRKQQRQTGRASCVGAEWRVVERTERSWGESSEPLVAEATWLQSCFIYLRPVASSAQVEFHSWNLNKGGQGFSRFILSRSSSSSALRCAGFRYFSIKIKYPK